MSAIKSSEKFKQRISKLIKNPLWGGRNFLPPHNGFVFLHPFQFFHGGRVGRCPLLGIELGKRQPRERLVLGVAKFR